jgi:hypothetical protein
MVFPLARVLRPFPEHLLSLYELCANKVNRFKPQIDKASQASELPSASDQAKHTLRQALLL